MPEQLFRDLRVAYRSPWLPKTEAFPGICDATGGSLSFLLQQPSVPKNTRNSYTIF